MLSKKGYSSFTKIDIQKLRLQSYRNTKKIEQKTLNNFKRIFGNEKDVIVCFGDYEQTQQIKYKGQPKEKV
jgi:hypothetical protein